MTRPPALSRLPPVMPASRSWTSCGTRGLTRYGGRGSSAVAAVTITLMAVLALIWLAAALLSVTQLVTILPT